MRAPLAKGDGMRARGLFFVEPGKVEIRPVDLDPPRPGQVLVRTDYSGISVGTELLAYRGQLDPQMLRDEQLGALSGTFRYPFAYGYSCVGRVERSLGTVAPDTAVFAFHPHQDRFVVDEADLVVLDNGVDLRQATLFPLVETALQVVLDCGAGLREPVVVVGLGTVGTLVALLLGRAGAIVLGVEAHQVRRELAGRLGVLVGSPAEADSLVAELTGGRGVALLVEASGAPQALAHALDLMAHEGSVVVASWYGTKPVLLPLGGAFHRRRLTIRSTQVSTIRSALAPRWDMTRRRQAARELLAELPLAELPAREAPFAEAGEAYAALDAGTGDYLHARLRYQ
jgi:2-desacetyl-2-hydroxyethyl bacteriochlorophyllide A dehydrogenase